MIEGQVLYSDTAFDSNPTAFHGNKQKQSFVQLECINLECNGHVETSTEIQQRSTAIHKKHSFVHKLGM